MNTRHRLVFGATGLVACLFASCSQQEMTSKNPIGAQATVAVADNSQTEDARKTAEDSKTSGEKVSQLELRGAVDKADEPQAASVAGPKQAAKLEPALPQPTAEQLSRWERSAYEPLQLLEYREDRSIGFISMIQACNDDKHFLTAGTRLYLWSVDGKEAPVKLLAANVESVIVSLAVSPQADWCAVLQKDGWLRVFSLTERKEILAKQLESKQFVAIAIATDASEIAVVARNREVLILNPKSLEQTSRFQVDAREVSALAFIKPKVLLAAGATTSSWDTATGKLLKTYPAQRDQCVLAQSPDRTGWMFVGKDQLQHWSVTDDRLLGTVDDAFARNEFVRFSPDGKQLATLNASRIRIWDVASGQLQQVIDHTGSSPVGLCWIPGTRLLVVASDSGRLRFWGDVESATSRGLTPLHSAVVSSELKPHEPATAEGCLRAIDLRLLPKFPGSKLAADSHSVLNGTLPTTADEARLFYRYVVGQLGWIETSDPSVPDTLVFSKDGFDLSISVYQSSPTETYVNLHHAGNYQYAWAPKVTSVPVEIVHESRHSVMYKVKSSLLQIETELLQKFHEAGWTAAAHLISPGADAADSRDFSFVWNGTILRVSIDRDREDATKHVVSYVKALTLFSLSIPPDSGLVEYNDYLDLQLVANTNLNLEQATAFYNKEMLRQGWLPRQSGGKISPELCWLPFLQGHREITIELVKPAVGKTQIRAGRYSDQSWQLALQKEAAGSEDATAAKSGDVGIQAAEFPIIAADSAPKYDNTRDTINYEIKPGTDLIEFSEQHSAAMQTLGWTTKPMVATTKTDFNVQIQKGEATIYFSGGVDPRGTITASAQSRNFLWTKEIPIAGQRISYIAWLRQKRKMATLELLDQYKQEMAAISLE